MPVLNGLSSGNGNGGDAALFDGQAGTYYLDRTHHTGAQATSTITGLDAALAAKASASALTTHVADTANPHSVTKSQVGLANVDNTSDANKPVSTAQQTALNGKQDIDATLTALSGVSTAANKIIYAIGSDAFSTTDLTSFARTILDDADAAAVRTTIGAASTQYVDDAVAGIVDSSPTTLNTLNELAAALGDDPNFATTITGLIGAKQAGDATLTALAGVTTAADKLIYATGSDTFGTTDLTSFARTLLDDTDAASMRATLGVSASGTALQIASNLSDVAAPTTAVNNLFGAASTGSGGAVRTTNAALVTPDIGVAAGNSLLLSSTNVSTGTVATVYGSTAKIFNNSTGTITSAIGYRVLTPANASGTLTSTYGLYLDSQAAGTQTNTPYGIYQAGANDWNFFSGRVGIKNNNLTNALLYVNGGTGSLTDAGSLTAPMAIKGRSDTLGSHGVHCAQFNANSVAGSTGAETVIGSVSRVDLNCTTATGEAVGLWGDCFVWTNSSRGSWGGNIYVEVGAAATSYASSALGCEIGCFIRPAIVNEGGALHAVVGFLPGYPGGVTSGTARFAIKASCITSTTSAFLVDSEYRPDSFLLYYGPIAALSNNPTGTPVFTINDIGITRATALVLSDSTTDLLSTPPGGEAFFIANNGAQWSVSNFGTNLVIKSGSTARNPCIGIFSSFNTNPVAIGNNGGDMVFLSQVPLGDTTNAPATLMTLTGTSGNLSVLGSVKSTSPTAGVGYATGAGGTQTQGTSRTTGVTLNAVSGAITLFSAAGSATPFVFTVTNSTVAATDTVDVSVKSGTTDTYYAIGTAVAAGSFKVVVWDLTGTTTESPVIKFNVIKGADA